MARRPAGNLNLSSDERQKLLTLARQSKASQALALRARIILACADGAENKRVADRFDITPHTVGKWRKRFVETRLESLRDKPRSGAPRVVTDKLIDEVVGRTLAEQSANGLHWTSRTLGAHMNMSPTAIFRIWQAFGLKPHRHASFNPSAEPAFAARLRDVAGLYLDQHLCALAICVDKESAKAPIKVKPRKTGAERRKNPARSAFGMAELFAFVSAARHGKGVASDKPYGGLVNFLKLVEQHVPSAYEVVLIVESNQARLSPAAQSWLLRRPHFRVRFAPSMASWLYQLQRCRGMLTALSPALGGHDPAQNLEAMILHAAQSKDVPVKLPLLWIKPANGIKVTQSRFLLRTYETTA